MKSPNEKICTIFVHKCYGNFFSLTFLETPYFWRKFDNMPRILFFTTGQGFAKGLRLAPFTFDVATSVPQTLAEGRREST